MPQDIFSAFADMVGTLGEAGVETVASLNDVGIQAANMILKLITGGRKGNVPVRKNIGATPLTFEIPTPAQLMSNLQDTIGSVTTTAAEVEKF